MSASDVRVWPGRPGPMGATWDATSLWNLGRRARPEATKCVLGTSVSITHRRELCTRFQAPRLFFWEQPAGANLTTRIASEDV